MSWLFAVLKCFHLVLAVIACGFNATYALWITRAQRHPEQLDFAFLKQDRRCPGQGLQRGKRMTRLARESCDLVTRARQELGQAIDRSPKGERSLARLLPGTRNSFQHGARSRTGSDILVVALTL